MRPLFRIATSAVRWWTRLYTRGLPERAARLEEIESDLWEFAHDQTETHTLSPGLHVLLRLLLGMPSDLVWRVEQFGWRHLAARVVLTMACISALATTAFWLLIQLPAMPSAPPPPRWYA